MRDKPNELARPTNSLRAEEPRWGTWLLPESLPQGLWGESAVVNSCLIFSVVQRAPKAPSENSPPPSLLATSTLRGAIFARYFEKYMAVLSLVRKKSTLVKRGKSSLTIIMYSFPLGDCTNFGPARSTKHFSSGLTARVWVIGLTDFLTPFASEHPRQGASYPWSFTPICFAVLRNRTSCIPV